MSLPTAPEAQGSSTRPYLIRALHDWCTDNGFTPYVAVFVDDSVRVPMEYVKNGEIVLNVGFEATSGLRLGNDFIEFKARFGGVARDILVPVDHVVAIYARENGQGMAFPTPGDAVPGRPAGGLLATAASPSAPVKASDKSPDNVIRLAASAPEVTVGGVPPAPEPPPRPKGPAGPAGSPPRPSLKRVK